MAETLSPDVVQARNSYFGNDDVKALIAFMGEQGKTEYERKDIAPMDAFIEGYGGKGTYMSSSRFFNAADKAKADGLITRKGDLNTGITYALTEKGQQAYTDEIRPDLEKIALQPDAWASLVRPENRIAGYFNDRLAEMKGTAGAGFSRNGTH